MKRMMVYLSNETHEGLKKLACEASTSVTGLIRQAVEMAYGEDIEDIRDGEKELARYLANLGSAVDMETLHKRRVIG